MKKQLEELKTFTENQQNKSIKAYAACVEKDAGLANMYMGEHTAFSLIIKKIESLLSADKID